MKIIKVPEIVDRGPKPHERIDSDEYHNLMEY
jgi:hypothetical protein